MRSSCSASRAAPSSPAASPASSAPSACCANRRWSGSSRCGTGIRSRGRRATWTWPTSPRLRRDATPMWRLNASASGTPSAPSAFRARGFARRHSRSMRPSLAAMCDTLSRRSPSTNGARISKPRSGCPSARNDTHIGRRRRPRRRGNPQRQAGKPPLRASRKSSNRSGFPARTQISAAVTSGTACPTPRSCGCWRSSAAMACWPSIRARRIACLPSTSIVRRARSIRPNHTRPAPCRTP